MEIKIKIESDNIHDLTKVIDFLALQKKIDWDFISENISGNPSELTFQTFITRYIDRINFDKLSANKDIAWNTEFIQTYSHCLNFHHLSENSSIPFTKELIIKYKGRWKWKANNASTPKYADYNLGGLSYNPQIPLERDFISQVADKIDFRALGMNSSFVIFNPNNIPDDYWPFELDKLRTHILLLIDFWDKWSFEGSTWHDGNVGISGKKKDAIRDNEKIDWKFINEIKNCYQYFVTHWEMPEPEDDNDLPF